MTDRIINSAFSVLAFLLALVATAILTVADLVTVPRPQQNPDKLTLKPPLLYDQHGKPVPQQSPPRARA